MAWTALTLEVDAQTAGPLSDALVEAGALSVTLENAEGGATEPWARQRLIALVEPQLDAQRWLAAVAEQAGLASAPAFVAAPVADQDWVKASRAQFGPIEVSERLWIVPTWHAVPREASPGAIVLRLDPGLAFGTGSHPTTRLVLQFLERSVKGGERALDLGCGSGILAIAAARLGAAHVDAVDNDPQACAATRDNARANQVAVRVLEPGALASGGYDMVVANILARPLIELEPLIASCCRPAARLALAGVLETQAEEVSAAYAKDFRCTVSAAEQGWVLIEGERR